MDVLLIAYNKTWEVILSHHDQAALDIDFGLDKDWGKPKQIKLPWSYSRG